MASNTLRTPYMDRQTTETRECAVCLNERVDPCRTSCGHFFCEECLRSSLKLRPPWNRGRCPLCRAAVSLYDTVKSDLTTPLEKPAVDTIFGSAFLQNGRPGVAAYHFDGPDDCYISYENAPSSWKLADGEKPPERKAFDNPTWDPATRTFTATVDWSEHGPTCINQSFAARSCLTVGDGPRREKPPRFFARLGGVCLLERVFPVSSLALWSTPPTGFVRFATQSTDLGEGARCGSNRGARAGRPAPRMLQ